MTNQTRSSNQVGDEDMDHTDSQAIIPAENVNPVSHRGLGEDEAKRLEDQAVELVEQLNAAEGSAEMEILDGVANVGLHAQKTAASELGLLNARVGAFIQAGGASKDIADGMRDLRMTLDEINPQGLTEPSLAGRIFAGLPLVKGRYNPLTSALNKIVIRYEPVSKQVAQIEARLRDGRALLVRDNVELRKLYEDVEEQQAVIVRNAYLGEMLMARLTNLIEETDDPVKRDRLHGALDDVATRVQDLRTMEQVHLQYFVTIEMSRRNNTRLGQSVERTLTLTTSVVTVGLAIQSALIHQKGVSEATKRTRDFLGDLVAANASALRQHTEEIGDLYNNPVIAIEKITQAHDDLVEAITMASKLRQEGIETARQNIGQLSKLSAGLQDRAGSILAVPSEPKSIEALESGEEGHSG
jgi:uncharacterized protein YaaN involved in tellurite resistance